MASGKKFLPGFLQVFFENSYNIEEKLIKNVEDAAPLVLKDLVQCEEGKTEITVFGVPHILKAGQIDNCNVKKCFTFAEGAYKIKN